ncbi:hypothetical protein [Pseudacidovorax sp. NFM-22]|uniref:hypothetical protein n=1 Tax=Pseudacidovorax sp. NFM-22 TaxID=2744469 RepID=UPI001F48EB81|nr:hypothetical protein [Pseudacidovorax sp. NFM-22]
MSNLVQLHPLGRDAALEHLQQIVPAAVAATVHEVGVRGLQAFFDGYKHSVDESKKAA